MEMKFLLLARPALKTADSIYEARSWLLTAKNAAPALFSVQFAAYELELKERIFSNVLIFFKDLRTAP